MSVSGIGGPQGHYEPPRIGQSGEPPGTGLPPTIIVILQNLIGELSQGYNPKLIAELQQICGKYENDPTVDPETRQFLSQISTICQSMAGSNPAEQGAETSDIMQLICFVLEPPKIPPGPIPVVNNGLTAIQNEELQNLQSFLASYISENGMTASQVNYLQMVMGEIKSWLTPALMQSNPATFNSLNQMLNCLTEAIKSTSATPPDQFSFGMWAEDARGWINLAQLL